MTVLTHREQLISLFAGEMCEGDWLTTPYYDVALCVEIARCVDPGSEVSLRKAIYDDARPADSISNTALETIGIAYSRWRQIRHVQQRGRGL